MKLRDFQKKLCHVMDFVNLIFLNILYQIILFLVVVVEIKNKTIQDFEYFLSKLEMGTKLEYEHILTQISYINDFNSLKNNFYCAYLLNHGYTY